MKFAYLGLAFLIYSVKSVYEDPLNDIGLCIPLDNEVCDKSMQKYGICCQINGQKKFFNNYCLACQGGCDTWYKKKKDTPC